MTIPVTVRVLLCTRPCAKWLYHIISVIHLTSPAKLVGLSPFYQNRNHNSEKLNPLLMLKASQWSWSKLMFDLSSDDTVWVLNHCALTRHFYLQVFIDLNTMFTRPLLVTHWTFHQIVPVALDAKHHWGVISFPPIIFLHRTLLVLETSSGRKILCHAYPEMLHFRPQWEGTMTGNKGETSEPDWVPLLVSQLASWALGKPLKWVVPPSSPLWSGCNGPTCLTECLAGRMTGTPTREAQRLCPPLAGHCGRYGTPVWKRSQWPWTQCYQAESVGWNFITYLNIINFLYFSSSCLHLIAISLVLLKVRPVCKTEAFKGMSLADLFSLCSVSPTLLPSQAHTRNNFIIQW